MQASVDVPSKSVLGATELTLLATIKPGLIPAPDTRSYVTRAAAVLATLHGLGVSRREVEPTPAIAEAADRIKSIRSFRMAIVGTEVKQVLLSVSFDGGWEPYLRKIWRDLGSLLDLVFCHCEGYLLSRDHGYAAYADWVRRSQVKTAFYFEGSPLTVADQQDLLQELGQPMPAPASAARNPFEQARPAILALYRLRDLFPPLAGSDDALTLWRAARLLLPAPAHSSWPVEVPPAFRQTPTQAEAWRWFVGQGASPELEATPCDGDAGLEVAKSNVQAGILQGHAGITHGCLVLVALDGPAGFGALIDHLLPDVLSAADEPQPLRPRQWCANLAFTHAGLILSGLDAGSLSQLPPEFQEGMAARAGLLGDWEHNHPMHWPLPQAWNAPQQRVEMSQVHAVVQFVSRDQASRAWEPLKDPTIHNLHRLVQILSDKLQGHGQVLSVEPMQRQFDSQGHTRGHFGFVDGLSQPHLGLPADTDQVEPGDLLLGYRNGLCDPTRQGRLWTDSSFVAIRKLRQYAGRWQQQANSRAAQEMLMGRGQDGHNLIDGTTRNDFDYRADPAGAKCPLYSHVRRANPRQPLRPDLQHLPRIMRRGMSYGPAVPSLPSSGTADDIDREDRGLIFMAYNASIAEQFELVQAWLAGANSAGPGSRSVQRDPLLSVGREGDPRRYEWVDASGQSHHVDLPADQPLTSLQWGLYAFVPSLAALRELRAVAHDRALEDAIADIDAPPQGFDPAALQRKRDRRDRIEATLAARGAALIARLQMAEQLQGTEVAASNWKLALEDPASRTTGTSPAIWAAIRRVHGGALRTPYGVVVASKRLVRQVFDNVNGHYTVAGYNTRLKNSFGEIYLGRDAGAEYDEESASANAAVMRITSLEAFCRTRDHTRAVIEGLRHGSGPATAAADTPLDIKDIVDGVLAALCRDWFGIPDGLFVQAGGWHWRGPEVATEVATDPGSPAGSASCPAHFHAPSRYTFQPQPGTEARQLGEAHGQLLRQQVRAWIKAERAWPTPPAVGVIGQRLFAAFSDDATGNDRLASTLIGVMMGFLPTVDGNLRTLLADWIQTRSLWDHQARLRRSGAAEPSLDEAMAVLYQPLMRTLHQRPVPELVWRTARQAHSLGTGLSPVSVRPGDAIVVSIVSAMQEDEAAERLDPFTVFGGDRRAPAHATHACPGYDMAIGVMFGFVSAMLTDFRWRPAASAASLRLQA